MRDSYICYEELDNNQVILNNYLVVLETDFKIKVIRNAILNDSGGFKPEEHQAKDGVMNEWFLHSTGGQAIAHKEWNNSWLIHYVVGSHKVRGLLELTPSFVSKEWMK